MGDSTIEAGEKESCEHSLWSNCVWLSISREGYLEYLGLFHVFYETWLTDTISVLGGLKESVFRVEMHREEGVESTGLRHLLP
jgi:hypothetical protein